MNLAQALNTLRPSGPEDETTRWLPLALVVLVVALVAAFGLNAMSIRTNLLDMASKIPACLVVGMVFGTLPILICFVQTVTQKRLQGKLNGLMKFPVSRTVYYVTAKNAIDSMTPAALLNQDYLMPFLIFFAFNAAGFGLIYGAFPTAANFEAHNLILGGLYVLDKNVTPAEQQAYQAATFVMMSVAFIGAYVYMLGRLIDRLNNNDLYPTAIYYYVVRGIVATIAAAVIHHTAGAIDVAGSSEVLLLLAFTTGLAPDLFILAMARKAFQAIKIIGGKNDPASENRPIGLPLIMIDDITRDKIDRLNELGIDTAQVLACQNPLAIWLKLPYELGLIVQWIAAAQLYTMVKEKRLLALRDIGILTIFDLRCRLDVTEAAAQVCKLMDIPDKAAEALIKQLDTDSCFVRLRDVRDAMTQSTMLTV